MHIAEFKKLPVMGILRGIEKNTLGRLIQTIISSGLKTIEITMNTPDAANLLQEAVRLSANKLVIGAGTVLTMDSLKCALDRGATFIVSPTLVEEVVTYCVSHSVCVFPGAFSPREILSASNAGATMVKVFPSKFFGPEYIKEIKGPFNDIELLACGGVSPDTIGDYFSCGASAVAFGASVFRHQWLQNEDFKSIENAIKACLQSEAWNFQYSSG